jgi:RimJ/RimL family protein N-acetyltransferase
MKENELEDLQEAKNKVSDTIIQSINSLHIESDRLILKKFSCEDDIEHNIQHESNPVIMQYIRDPISSEAILKKTLDVAANWTGIEQVWTMMSLRLKQTNDYIGMVCFRYESIENDTVEMGWRLHPDYFGKGYATEAASTFLNFIKQKIKPHKVVAYCVAENTASSNIMSKLGMQHEARLREFSKLNGIWCDEDIYGILLN